MSVSLDTVKKVGASLNAAQVDALLGKIPDNIEKQLLELAAKLESETNASKKNAVLAEINNILKKPQTGASRSTRSKKLKQRKTRKQRGGNGNGGWSTKKTLAGVLALAAAGLFSAAGRFGVEAPPPPGSLVASVVSDPATSGIVKSVLPAKSGISPPSFFSSGYGLTSFGNGSSFSMPGSSAVNTAAGPLSFSLTPPTVITEDVVVSQISHEPSVLTAENEDLIEAEIIEADFEGKDINTLIEDFQETSRQSIKNKKIFDVNSLAPHNTVTTSSYGESFGLGITSPNQFNTLTQFLDFCNVNGDCSLDIDMAPGFGGKITSKHGGKLAGLLNASSADTEDILVEIHSFARDNPGTVVKVRVQNDGGVGPSDINDMLNNIAVKRPDLKGHLQERLIDTSTGVPTFETTTAAGKNVVNILEKSFPEAKKGAIPYTDQNDHFLRIQWDKIDEIIAAKTDAEIGKLMIGNIAKLKEIGEVYLMADQYKTATGANFQGMENYGDKLAEFTTEVIPKVRAWAERQGLTLQQGVTYMSDETTREQYEFVGALNFSENIENPEAKKLFVDSLASKFAKSVRGVYKVLGSRRTIANLFVNAAKDKSINAGSAAYAGHIALGLYSVSGWIATAASIAWIITKAIGKPFISAGKAIAKPIVAAGQAITQPVLDELVSTYNLFFGTIEDPELKLKIAAVVGKVAEVVDEDPTPIPPSSPPSPRNGSSDPTNPYTQPMYWNSGWKPTEWGNTKANALVRSFAGVPGPGGSRRKGRKGRKTRGRH